MRMRLLSLALFVLTAHATALGAEPLSWFAGGRPSVQAQQAIELVTDAASHGLDPHDYLERNDSYPFFDGLGDLLKTGPTGTNVMDLMVVLVAGP